MPFNAVFFGKGDLDLPIPNRNSMAFRMSASFIDQNYPSPSTSLIRQVRVLIAKQLSTGRATQTTVANMLGMHSRTLQRRLRAEGVSFEAIVDNVRKEITLRNLADKSVLLTEIVERIGYSETSVLTRSCRRWFSQTPTDIRMKSERTGAVH
jgi:AraC-like DNA-binding protein